MHLLGSALWTLAAAALSSPAASQDVETLQLRVGELVFDARAAGPTDGELVLLLHGFPETSYAFRHVIRRIAAAGFRAVAFDQRGYSPGARPEAVEDYAMRRLVEDVVGVAEALGRRRFHLVGHDWGGAVAWVTAIRHPDRLLSLTVISTPHVIALAETATDPRSDQAARSAYMKDFAAEGSEERLLAHGAAGLRRLFGSAVPQEDVELYLHRLGTERALRAALNWYRASSAGSGRRSTGAFPDIDVPTLYVWGTDDPVFGRGAAEATARHVKGPYRFVPLEGVGHWVLEEAQGRSSEALLAHLERWRSIRSSRLTLSRDLVSSGRLGGVSAGQDGSIYVSNFRASVWRVSPAGEVVTLTSSLRGASGNTVDRNGNLLQASFLDGRVVRITRSGETSDVVEGGLEGPVGIVADDDGGLFVCNCRGSSIARVDPGGGVRTLVRSELLNCPNGITFGPDHALYVVSFENGKVVRISRKGAIQWFATLPGDGNAHIAFLDGAFYVTQIKYDRIYRLDLDGHYEPLPLEVSRPNGIAASPDGHSLYLNELDGPWRSERETRILLRRIDLRAP